MTPKQVAKIMALVDATAPFVKLFQQVDAKGMGGRTNIDAQIAVNDLRRLVYAADDASAALRDALQQAEPMASVEIFRLDANINGVDHQLVEFVRYEDHTRVVHDLETICDPAGLVRENAQLRDTNEGLQRMYRALAARPGAASAVMGKSLLRPVGEKPTMCYCPPGVCQAPKPQWCINNRECDQVVAAPTAVEPDERDTERLNWLEKNGGQHTVCIAGRWYVRDGYGSPHIRAGCLRSAIDGAISAKKGGGLA